PKQMSLPPISASKVHVLDAMVTIFALGSTFPLTGPVRFQYEPSGGGSWNEIAADFRHASQGPEMLWAAKLYFAGIPAGSTLRGRFVAAGPGGEVFSESFLFTFCPVTLAAAQLPSPPNPPGSWQLTVESADPLSSVRVRARAPDFDRTFVL